MIWIPSNVCNCTQQPRIKSASIQMNLVKCAQLHLTTSNHIHFNSNDLNALKCAQLHSTTSNHVFLNSNDLNALKCAQRYPTTNQILFNLNDLQYTQICTNALNQLKSPFKHLQTLKLTLTTSNVHLYTSEASISKPPNFQASTNAPNIHLQWTYAPSNHPNMVHHNLYNRVILKRSWATIWCSKVHLVFSVLAGTP